MLYSECSDVAPYSGAPTRVQRNAKHVAYLRPKTRASNHPRFFRFAAISQDPFACVFCTPAPLAERNCPAPPFAGIDRFTQNTNRPVVFQQGIRTPRRCYFNVEMIGEPK